MSRQHSSLSRLLALACMAALLLGLDSCSSSRSLTAKPGASAPASTKPTNQRRPQQPVVITLPSNPGRAKVVAEAETWLGVPYKYGGNDRDGVDCSGFVSQVFLGSSKIKLPRTSRTQREATPNLGREELEAGDLVFFDTSKSRLGEVNHVGVYVGNGQMIHASTSKGVIVSDIDGIFYGDRFLGGGRVLPQSAPEKRPAPTPVPTPIPAPTPSKPTPAPIEAAKPATVTAPIQAAKPAPKPIAKQAPMPAAASAPAPDARGSVLERLIEQKIDSIYAAK